MQLSVSIVQIPFLHVRPMPLEAGAGVASAKIPTRHAMLAAKPRSFFMG